MKMTEEGAAHFIMSKPLLIIVNGPPGAGKTTLAKRLAHDLKLPALHRDGIAETLFDALDCQTHGRPVLIGVASFKLLHYCAGLLLAVGQSLIVEGSFHIPELATAEFRQLQAIYDFAPLQVQCVVDGQVLLERFLSRARSADRHVYHRDLEFAEHNRELILKGRYADLELGGQIVEIDTTDVHGYDYSALLERVRQALVEIA